MKGGTATKQLLRLLIAVLCVLGLSVGAAAASVRVETMSVEMTVDENGTAKAEVAAHLEADAPVDSLSITLGPNVSGVHVAGQKADVSRAGGQSTLTLGGESGLSFPMFSIVPSSYVSSSPRTFMKSSASTTARMGRTIFDPFSMTIPDPR